MDTSGAVIMPPTIGAAMRRMNPDPVPPSTWAYPERDYRHCTVSLRSSAVLSASSEVTGASQA